MSGLSDSASCQKRVALAVNVDYCRVEKYCVFGEDIKAEFSVDTDALCVSPIGDIVYRKFFFFLLFGDRNRKIGSVVSVIEVVFSKPVGVVIFIFQFNNEIGYLVGRHSCLLKNYWSFSFLKPSPAISLASETIINAIGSTVFTSLFSL